MIPRRPVMVTGPQDILDRKQTVEAEIAGSRGSATISMSGMGAVEGLSVALAWVEGVFREGLVEEGLGELREVVYRLRSEGEPDAAGAISSLVRRAAS